MSLSRHFSLSVGGVHKSTSPFSPSLLRRRAPPTPLNRTFPVLTWTAAVVGPTAEAPRGQDYDWKEEWYPLYLTEEVPADAPLAVKVFDEMLVLYRDGNGAVRCLKDRCPHRLAKLSEGQVIDGRLECLYHGWQFGEDGKCLKIPQLPEGAKIPRAACATKYEIQDSQGVIWVWMSTDTEPDTGKLPYFEHYSRQDFQSISTIHSLPYDHSLVLENLMDLAHVPISHDRSDFYSKREDAQPLHFEVTERSPRGFAGTWRKSRNATFTNYLRFEAPCALQNNHSFVDKKNNTQHVSSLFLARPTGQGSSTVIMRFGTTLRSPFMKYLPKWFFHQNICKVFEQDMGFLSSQNEILVRARMPVSKLYLSIVSCDTWVTEYRKWHDTIGHGMPYYYGHTTFSLPQEHAVIEQAPAGPTAGVSASMPAKGAEECAGIYSANVINRYFRHVVHCKECRGSLKGFKLWMNLCIGSAVVSVSVAILVSSRRWKVVLLVLAAMFVGGGYACQYASKLITTNFIRDHRKL